jgi:plastocyanin
MTRSCAFICLFWGCCVAPGSAGEIRAHVTITQGLTKRRVTLPAYQLRGAPVKLPPQTSTPVDELNRVAIYLEGRDLRPARPLNLEMTQRDRLFEPDILIVPIGSTISFPNADPIFHNVFSLSKAKEFDLGYYPSGQSRSLRFDKAGIAQVYCHLHPNMSAAIVVTSTAWYGQPAADGTLILSDVPAGDYTIVAWHKSAGFLSRRILMPETGSIDIELTLPLRDKKEK